MLIFLEIFCVKKIACYKKKCVTECVEKIRVKKYGPKKRRLWDTLADASEFTNPVRNVNIMSIVNHASVRRFR